MPPIIAWPAVQKRRLAISQAFRLDMEVEAWPPTRAKAVAQVAGVNRGVRGGSGGVRPCGRARRYGRE